MRVLIHLIVLVRMQVLMALMIKNNSDEDDFLGIVFVTIHDLYY